MIELSSNNQLEEESSGKLTRRHVIIILSLIGVGGLLFRLNHVQVEVPLIWDAVLYFWYANDVALLDALPTSYIPANNGWPIFLSFFFQFIDSGSYLDYMLVQRLTGVVLSVLTIVPIYLICRRFFPEKFALIGPAIFVFEPRVADNSFLGVTEPLFVLLIAMTVACFLSDRKRVVFFTFPLIALASIVRGEAIILVIPFTILYIIRFRHSRKTAYEIPLLILILMLILMPIITHRIEVAGTDGIFVRIWDAIGSAISNSGSVAELSDGVGDLGNLANVIMSSLRNMPIMLLFVPYGLYRIFKNMEMKNLTVITILAFMAVPTAYALTAFLASRYLFWMIPIWCIFCVFSISRLAGIFSGRDIALVIIVGLIVVSFVVISENKHTKINSYAEKDGQRIAEIVSKSIGDGRYVAEVRHFPDIRLWDLDKFPILRSEVNIRGEYIKYCDLMDSSNCDSIVDHTSVIAEFLRMPENENITHLVIDDVQGRYAKLLVHIFQNEQEYPYLTKIYDSRDDGFSYHVKIFEIEHKKLNSSHQE